MRADGVQTPTDRSEFADPPPLSMEGLNLEESESAASTLHQASAPAARLPDSLPNSLLGFAHLVLATAEPMLKCALTREAVSQMRAGKLRSIRPNASEIRRARDNGDLLDIPPRLQETVQPGQVGKRCVLAS